MEPIRWGVVGTGVIADEFTRDLRLLPSHVMAAVGSRTQQRADEFGAQHGIAHRHATYEQLVQDPAVDVVYVATPNPEHSRVAHLAIAAGKAVLVEKPFAMDAAEAREVVAAARERGTFVMEAMWTRFLPRMRAIRALVEEGRIGDLSLVLAELSFVAPDDPESRLLSQVLGGGALLDVGVYTVSLAQMLLGRPGSVLAASTPARTGVDATTSVILGFPGGAQALLTGSLRAHGGRRAAVLGTAGRVEIDGAFYVPGGYRVVTVTADGEEVVESVEVTTPGHGLRFEAAEVGRCLREGLTESPLMPWEDTISVLETLDEIRRQIGLEFPRSG